MKNLKKILIAVMLVAVVAVSALMLVGCSSNTLVVATNAEFPPFEYYDDNGNMTGFDIELIQLIGKEMGYKKVKINHMDFDSVVPSVQQNQADVAIAGLTVDEERLEKVDFSKTYFDATQIILYKGETKTFADEAAAIEFLKSCNKVGVCLGYSGDMMVSDILADEKITRATNGMLAVEDLKNGVVDAVVIDKEPGKVLANKYAANGVKADTTDLGSEQYAIACQKGDTKMVEAVNAALAKLIENGEYKKLYDKYFG